MSCNWSPEEVEEEDEVQLDLEFDAPQWEDLQKEKDLQEQGVTVNSGLHDDWFKKVHPLHEAKLNVNPQVKAVVDRKGNKLSLEISKSGPCGKRSGSGKDELKPGKAKVVQNGILFDNDKKVVKKPRKCWDLNGCKPLNISPSCTDKHGSTSRKQSNDEMECEEMDKELRAMLDAHNRRIMKQQAEYDENGRRIKKGNPETCPAPTKGQPAATQSRQSRLKNKRRSVNVTRPEAPKEAKQKRRSCFTLSTVQETDTKPSRVVPPPSSSNTTTTTTSHGGKTRPLDGKNRPGLTTNTAKIKTTLNRQRSFKSVEKQSSNKALDAEQEIQELIAQHNLKVAAKAKNKQK